MAEEKMPDQMWEVMCEPSCGFMVRSHDRDEVVRLTLEHTNGPHQESFTEKDISGDIYKLQHA